jgi:hypothetical protein
MSLPGYQSGPRYRPYLQPTSGLGQAARTNGAILISSPRNNIGSQGRIYSYYKKIGQGPEYLALLNGILQNNPKPRNLLNVIG